MGESSQEPRAAAEVSQDPGAADVEIDAPESWEKLDIDQTQHGQDGQGSRRLRNIRFMPVAAALVAVAALGAIAAGLRRRRANTRAAIQADRRTWAERAARTGGFGVALGIARALSSRRSR